MAYSEALDSSLLTWFQTACIYMSGIYFLNSIPPYAALNIAFETNRHFSFIYTISPLYLLFCA